MVVGVCTDTTIIRDVFLLVILKVSENYYHFNQHTFIGANHYKKYVWKCPSEALQSVFH